MCQLTLIHGRTDLCKVLLPNLTMNNASDGNKDGHGYFVVPKMMWRTTTSGIEAVFDERYIPRLEEFIEDDKKTTIVSHVRSASYKFKDLVNIENTHPFQVDNIILMHNGTLSTKNEKLEIEDHIDSLWFTQHLASIVKGKNLKPSHISKAMKEFTGKFAFLIVDMQQPTKIFVARGKTADLYSTTFKDGRNRVLATVINTSDDNLKLSSVPMYWRAFRGTSLKIEEPKILDEESIYIFDTKTGVLKKTRESIEENNTISSVTRVHPNIGPYNDDHDYGLHMGYGHGRFHNSVGMDTMIDKISNLAFTMRLGYTEMNLIFQMLFNIPMLFATKDHIEPFLDTLELIAGEYGKRVGKKLAKWQRISTAYYYTFPEGNSLDLYNRTGLIFPWFMQSGGEIKHVSSSIRSGNFNWEKNS